MTGIILASTAATGPIVTAGPGGTHSHIVLSPANADAQLTFNAAGQIQFTTGSLGNWIIPPGLASGSYEIKCDITSGTFTSSAGTGTWLALSSPRTWSKAQVGVGVASVSFNISIRRAGVVLSVKSYTLQAQVEV